MNKFIEVILPEEADDLTVHYQKVAEREGFDVADAEEMLCREITYEGKENVGNADTFRIIDLEDGIYQIYISGDEEYEFTPMLVSMPAWTTEGEQLLYEVSVTPKYTKQVKPQAEHTTLMEIPILDSPKTSDGNQGAVFGVLGLISFIIVTIMSCHNRLKCARMSQ